MKKFIFLIFISFLGESVANRTSIKKLEKEVSSIWKLSKTDYKYLQNSKVLSKSNVTDKNGQQKFNLKALALHPYPCFKALRKLSQLDQYSNWIDFIKTSHYNSKNRLFTLTADHTLLPYPMIIHIIVDKPTKTGKYPFIFPTGMFTGLKGEFVIKDFENKCLFTAYSNWEGKKGKIPNFVIELFSETLSRIGGEILIKKTRY